MSDLTAADVRAELDAWLDENWDPDLTVADWWKRLAEGRWSSPAIPTEAGGRGYGRDLVAAVSTGLAEAGVVGPPTGLGSMLAAPTIAACGSEEQRTRWLRPLFTGEEVWCQLFSEPGAGSDVAGLATRAIRDGDEWTVNGQKVWTSGAHRARWGLLVTRTDPDAPKHRGLTYFAVDMDQPGIEVRPLREMTGEALFNEVFLDEARVSNDDVIGGLGDGWAVAMGTLGFERGASTLGQQTGYRQELDALMDLARTNGTIDDPVLRQDLMQAHAELEIMRWNNLRMLSVLEAGGAPGPEMSIGKLFWASWHRRLGELGMRIRGASGMVGVDATVPPEDPLDLGYELDGLQRTFLYSRSHTIYAGTNQVQRNVLGERVLGLPREPR